MAKTSKSNKTQTLILRVPNELKTILQNMADNDNRKLSDYVRLQLMKMVNFIPSRK